MTQRSRQFPTGSRRRTGSRSANSWRTGSSELRAADVLGPATYSQPMAPGVWQPSGDGYNTGVVATTWPSLTPFALRSATVSRAAPSGTHESRIRDQRQPDQEPRRQVLQDPNTRSNGRRVLLVQKRPDPFQRARARTGHVTRVRPVANRTALRTPERRDGRWFDGSLRHEVRLHFWRPIAAIRGAADDRNDATEPDPTWDSLLPLIAAHPGYTSQHAVIAAAAATVLARFFGDHTTFTLSTGSGRPTASLRGPIGASLMQLRRTQLRASGWVASFRSRRTSARFKVGWWRRSCWTTSCGRCETMGMSDDGPQR